MEAKPQVPAKFFKDQGHVHHSLIYNIDTLYFNDLRLKFLQQKIHSVVREISMYKQRNRNKIID